MPEKCPKCGKPDVFVKPCENAPQKIHPIPRVALRVLSRVCRGFFWVDLHEGHPRHLGPLKSRAWLGLPKFCGGGGILGIKSGFFGHFWHPPPIMGFTKPRVRVGCGPQRRASSPHANHFIKSTAVTRGWGVLAQARPSKTARTRHNARQCRHLRVLRHRVMRPKKSSDLKTPDKTRARNFSSETHEMPPNPINYGVKHECQVRRKTPINSPIEVHLQVQDPFLGFFRWKRADVSQMKPPQRGGPYHRFQFNVYSCHLHQARPDSSFDRSNSCPRLNSEFVEKSRMCPQSP